MDWIKILTPKQTEEVKPGLFIQKTKSGYRQIYPSAWNGKVNWKNTIIGPDFFKTIIWLGILFLLVYGYTSSVSNCQEFQKHPCDFLPNITAYCSSLEQINNPMLNHGGDLNGWGDSNSLQSYP